MRNKSLYFYGFFANVKQGLGKLIVLMAIPFSFYIMFRTNFMIGLILFLVIGGFGYYIKGFSIIPCNINSCYTLYFQDPEYSCIESSFGRMFHYNFFKPEKVDNDSPFVNITKDNQGVFCGDKIDLGKFISTFAILIGMVLILFCPNLRKEEENAKQILQ